MKKILIFCDLIILIIFNLLLIYLFFIPFHHKHFNIKNIFIILIYGIINLTRIIIINIYYKKYRLIKSNIIEYWLILSIIFLFASIFYITVLFMNIQTA